MIEAIKHLFECITAKDLYTVVITIAALFFLIRSMYNNIKYLCLLKATEKIACVEECEDLTGDEKFALVVCWINTDLPKVFNNSATQTLIEKIIKKAYDGSFKYAQNYIKRKTGYDVAELLNIIKRAGNDAKTEVSTEVVENK